jgi:hypothetical protein
MRMLVINVMHASINTAEHFAAILGVTCSCIVLYCAVVYVLISTVDCERHHDCPAYVGQL